MARKKSHFQWTAEEGDAPPLGERPDRHEKETLRQELHDLARTLEAMPAGRLRRLPLDEAVIEAVLHLAALGAQSAHRRQLLRVQKLLREMDLAALEAAMAHEAPRSAGSSAAERWRTRLLEGGDEALAAYLEEHPRADRQRLRALIRQASKLGPVAEGAARKLLEELRATELRQEPARGA